MTERDRLIKLLEYAHNYGGDTYVEISDREELADYLLENGVIVPSYNVGDTLYLADKETSNEVEELHIEGIETFKYEGLDGFVCFVYRAFITSGKRKGEGVKFTDSNKNRIVFLTKEEAEKALKGGAE